MAEDPRYQQALQALDQGKVDDAFKLFEELVSTYPDNATYHHDLGVLLNRVPALRQKALSHISRAVDLEPKNWLFMNTKGECLRLSGSLSEAEELFRRAISLNQDNKLSRNNLAIVLSGLRRFDEALQLLDEALSLDSAFPEALLTKGNTLRRMGRVSDAVPFIKEAIKCRPNMASAWGNLGACLRLLGETDRAISALNKALELDPRLTGAMNTKAEILKSLGKMQEAGQIYVQAVNADPTNVESQLGAVTILAEMGLPKEAYAHYKRVKAVFDNSPEAHGMVARSLWDARMQAEGIEIAEGLVKKGVATADVYCVLAEYSEMSKNIESALGHIEKGLALTPSHTKLLASRAGIMKDIGELQKSLDDYVAAFESSTDDPTHMFNVVQGYEYLCDLDKAMSSADGFMSQFGCDIGKSIGSSESSGYSMERLTTVNHFAMYLIMTKHAYLLGDVGRSKELCSIIGKSFPPVVYKPLQALKTHWAYYFFISNLLAKTPPTLPIPEAKPLFLIGDSHVVAPSWRTIMFKGEKRLLVPRLVTGLKMWHLRKGNKFLTASNTNLVLDRMPTDVYEAIFVCGEIDCREGIEAAVEKGKYKNRDEAVNATVNVYNDALLRLEEEFGFRLYVHPVTPPCHDSTIIVPIRAELVQKMNKRLRDTMGPLRYLDFGDDLSDDKGILRRDFHCDAIHMNGSYIGILESSLAAASSSHRRAGQP